MKTLYWGPNWNLTENNVENELLSNYWTNKTNYSLLARDIYTNFNYYLFSIACEIF